MQKITETLKSDKAFVEDLHRYIDELTRVRHEFIRELLIEFYERKDPDPEDVVLIERHDRLQTVWYFSTKQRLEEDENEIYNR